MSGRTPGSIDRKFCVVTRLITRHAKEWVAAHRQQFDQWLQASRDAAAQAGQ